MVEPAPDQLDRAAGAAGAERLEERPGRDVLVVDLGGYLGLAARVEDAEGASEQRPGEAAAAVVGKHTDEPETRPYSVVPDARDADVRAGRFLDRDQVGGRIEGGLSELLTEAGLVPRPAVGSRHVLTQPVVEDAEAALVDPIGAGEEESRRDIDPAEAGQRRVGGDQVAAFAAVDDEAELRVPAQSLVVGIVERDVEVARELTRRGFDQRIPRLGSRRVQEEPAAVVRTHKRTGMTHRLAR